MKRTGRPLALALNMFDIATRRGIAVDVAALSAALGVPVVTSVAVRKGGTADLLQLADTIAAEPTGPARDNEWHPYSAAELRALQREADRIISAAVSQPARPTPGPRGSMRVLLRVRAGDPRRHLFVMFQACSPGAAGDGTELGGFEAIGHGSGDIAGGVVAD